MNTFGFSKEKLIENILSVKKNIIPIASISELEINNVSHTMNKNNISFTINFNQKNPNPPKQYQLYNITHLNYYINTEYSDKIDNKNGTYIINKNLDYYKFYQFQFELVNKIDKSKTYQSESFILSDEPNITNLKLECIHSNFFQHLKFFLKFRLLA